MLVTDFFRNFSTGNFFFKILGTFDRKSAGVIYLMNSNDCEETVRYVEETGQ